MTSSLGNFLPKIYWGHLIDKFATKDGFIMWVSCRYLGLWTERYLCLKSLCHWDWNRICEENYSLKHYEKLIIFLFCFIARLVVNFAKFLAKSVLGTVEAPVDILYLHKALPVYPAWINWWCFNNFVWIVKFLSHQEGVWQSGRDFSISRVQWQED